jgi:hypothetical protein
VSHVTSRIKTFFARDDVCIRIYREIIEATYYGNIPCKKKPLSSSPRNPEYPQAALLRRMIKARCLFTQPTITPPAAANKEMLFNTRLSYLQKIHQPDFSD